MPLRNASAVSEEDYETRPPLEFLLRAAERKRSSEIATEKNLLDEVVASMMKDPFWGGQFSSNFSGFRAESKVRLARLKIRLILEAQKIDRDESCSGFITSEGGLSVSTVS